MVHMKNSSDLDVGRRPELKSNEFFMSTFLVTKIWPSQLCAFSTKVSSILEHDPVENDDGVMENVQLVQLS